MKDSVINHRKGKSTIGKLYDMYLLERKRKDKLSNTAFFYRFRQGYTYSEIVKMEKYTYPKKKLVRNNQLSKRKEEFWIKCLQEEIEL